MLSTRRALLGVTALAVPAALLAGCAGQSVPTIAAQVVTDVNLIATSLKAQLPAFQAATGLNTAAAASVTALVQQIVAAGAQVVTGIAQNTAAPLAQQIASAFAALQTALGGFTLPATVQTIMQAVAALLPVVLAGVGLFAASAARNGVTPDQARAVLAAATGRAS